MVLCYQGRKNSMCKGPAQERVAYIAGTEGRARMINSSKGRREDLHWIEKQAEPVHRDIILLWMGIQTAVRENWEI